MTGSTSACSNRAQLKISRCAFNRCKHIFLFNRPVNQPIEKRVIAFSDHRIDRSQFDVVLPAELYHIFNQCVMHLADIQRSGQGNRCFQRSQFIQLHQSERFSKSIDYLGSSSKFMYKRVLNRRHNNSDSCLIITICNCPVSDPYTGYIGNQITFSARQ